MKKLKMNGSVTLKAVRGADGKPRTINIYNELINLLAIPSDPRAGLNYLDVAKRSKILDKLISANETKSEDIYLENADHEILCDCIKSYSFTIADPALDGWLKSILEAPEETPKPNLKVAS